MRIRLCFEEGGEVQRVILRHLDLTAAEVIEQLRQRYPERRILCWCSDSACACASALRGACQKVKDVMKPSITVDLDDSVESIARLFGQHDFHHLPVVSEGRLAGIISDRDILRSTSPFLGRASERPQDAGTMRIKAHQIMSHKPITIQPSASLKEAAALMEKTQVNCLPVVDRNHLLGIISSSDLIRAILGGE